MTPSAKRRVTFVYTTKSSIALDVPGDEVDHVVSASLDPISTAIHHCAEKLGMSLSAFEKSVVSMKIKVVA